MRENASRGSDTFSLPTTPPANIRLLVIDIDGTLLNPEGEIAPQTRASVQAAKEAGVVVTLATARRYCNTAPIADELGIDCPLILCDGALIVQHPQSQVLHTHPLQAAIAQQAVNIMASYEHDVQPVVHPNLGLIEEVWTGPAERDNLWIEAYILAYPDRVNRMSYAELCIGHPDPLRVVAFASEESIQALKPAISTLHCSWNAIKRGNYGCAELAVMAPNCTKASGVIALARTLHIPLTEVMAIGDNNNDIPMLQAAGWGVAMGQAPTPVKAVAQAITASNAEDGAAQAIDRYVLGAVRKVASNSRNRTTCL
ncbi:MAG TPA: Cof-type HAD-IIB family hydrolase [Ktedonobacteraceae bacterium]|nr:Cof-type HAD-IIB family hydrolase [Ktedonobacteraceae bacterium]